VLRRAAVWRQQQLPNKFDLMVIGPIGPWELQRRLAGPSQTLGLRINTHLMPAEEFKARKKERDRLLATALAKPPMFVVGNKRTLAGLV
jgi:hypothetical protein